MALDKQVFKTRTLTAIVFAAVMLVGLLTNLALFLALFILIMVGCLVEYLRLVGKIDTAKMLLFAATPLYILVPIFMLIDLARWPQTGTLFLGDFNFSAANYSSLLPCAIIFSIWINDTMAYVVGSFIGKTPLSKISPKKTWEGTIGGVVLCVALITLAGATVPAAKVIEVQHWFMIALLAAVFGSLGDLLESKIKRMAGVKDSGNFMPGHGGFLDRFDSLLLAVPAVWIYVRLFM